MNSSQKFMKRIWRLINLGGLSVTFIFMTRAQATPTPSQPEEFVPISEKHQDCSASDLQRFEKENRRLIDAHCAKVKNTPGIFYLAFPGRNGTTIYCQTPYVTEKPTNAGGNSGLMLMPFAFSCEARDMYLKSVKESEDWYKALCAQRKKCDEKPKQKTRQAQ